MNSRRARPLSFSSQSSSQSLCCGAKGCRTSPLSIDDKPLDTGNGEGEGLLEGMSLRFALRLTEVPSETTWLTVGVLGTLPEDTDGAGGTSRSFLEFLNSLSFPLRSRGISPCRSKSSRAALVFMALVRSTVAGNASGSTCMSWI